MKTLIISLLLCVIARMTLAERTNAVAAGGAELENRLRAIVIPEIEFSNADVCDILGFCWATLDPTPDESGRSVGLMYISPVTNNMPKRPRAILLPADDPELKNFSKITIMMRFASVMDLLDRVAKETGFSVTVGSTNLLIKTGTGRVIMNKSIDPGVGGTGMPARKAERPSPATTRPTSFSQQLNNDQPNNQQRSTNNHSSLSALGPPSSSLPPPLTSRGSKGVRSLDINGGL